MAPNAEAPKCFSRRDKLLEIESLVQKWWEGGDVFRADACEKAPKEGEKFFGNFPYPYMNGYLHLGHAFSLSKLEFAAAFHRLRGANVLLPFGFHCTGMPIKASADKLAREMRQFCGPPTIPSMNQETEEAKEEAEDGAPEKFKGKKSKAASKSGGQMFQWEIMRSFGLSDSEISKFQDPLQWLTYFPPLAMKDLKAFGLGCDWRRSFVTTDVNPFYDSFVQWQMRKLKLSGKVVKDLRYAIYSPLDGQPCADHDRATGEGVQPQEYTIIKMEVVSPFPSKLASLDGRNVYLAAATLRPETMYGQTNAWVLPDGNYGAYEINERDVFILTHRAARNLAYQSYSRYPEKLSCLAELVGTDLIGLGLKSPLAFNRIIHVLPMMTVLMDKGSGIVTCVPSDSPDDFMALRDLKTKPGLRAKFGIEDDWLKNTDVIRVIRIPEYGDRAAAEKLCTDMKIASQNDKEKLAEAKRLAYLKGNSEGTMLVGDFAGERVQTAKRLVREKLLVTGSAIPYSEPEKRIISRSGDDCVVALTEQWYITYGEPEWKTAAERCISRMEFYCDETRHGFERSLSWLNQWACSRSFGLGTRLPWDEQYLIESLSDSTIYMMYYTVSHLLHGGDMYASSSSSRIKPEEMTDRVWDYIFCIGSGDVPEFSDTEILKSMRREFEYWYPFDLRVSGKDLIQNHLTFCVYNHTAIMSERHWPHAFRCNGHIMLNAEKMSKSTGNFLTLRQAISDFSADATRFALADAGDGVDDANFAFETANAVILRLTKEIAWTEEVLAAGSSSFRDGDERTFADRVFGNEIDIAVRMTERHYREYLFREALKTGFYDLQAARDAYRLSCGSSGMHRALLLRFVDVQTRLITPVCPHYSEFVWRVLMKREGFVIRSGWPDSDPPDATLKSANTYLHDTIAVCRKLLQKQVPVSRRGERNELLSSSSARGLIYVNEIYDGWKGECLGILREKFDDSTRTFLPDQEIFDALRASPVGSGVDFKQVQKLCFPFMRFKKDEAVVRGLQALDLRLPFGEMDVLAENAELIRRQLGLESIQILSAREPGSVEIAGPKASLLKQNFPSPGNPTPVFFMN